MDYFKQHKLLSFLAATMAIISTLFLLQDIISTIKDDVIADFNANNTQNYPQENTFQIQLEQERQEKAALKAKLEALKKKNEFPGTVFRDSLADGGSGPEIVWIPAGSFTSLRSVTSYRMGDIQGDGYSNEKPVHRVSVGKFAMGKFEVTFAEYDKFVQATGRSKPSDNGWGRGNRPVINVSWNDATAYTKWLSNQTGKTYRLPTEAEWEYAARAGTETKYWWGNDVGKNRANCYGDYCGDSFKYTSPVGSFSSNKFGLYDTVGNVWEWTCSEYTNKYNGKEKTCINKSSNKNRVLRGGSWTNFPRSVRAANRGRNSPDDRVVYLGFRVVVMAAAWTK